MAEEPEWHIGYLPEQICRCTDGKHAQEFLVVDAVFPERADRILLDHKKADLYQKALEEIAFILPEKHNFDATLAWGTRLQDIAREALEKIKD